MSFEMFEALQRLKFSSSSGKVDIRNVAWGHLDTMEALKGKPPNAPDFRRLWADICRREAEDIGHGRPESSELLRSRFGNGQVG